MEYNEHKADDRDLNWRNPVSGLLGAYEFAINVKQFKKVQMKEGIHHTMKNMQSMQKW
jgi:hypothetical protein